MEESYIYDVVLSFAGEDREYVEKVAKILEEYKVRIFYDKNEIVDLWGKDLYVHLGEIYQNKGKYCVMFISEHYAKKLWTNHERENAQARAFRESREYILPARFDSTNIPGIRGTVGFIDLKTTSPEELSNYIMDKLKKDFSRNELREFKSENEELITEESQVEHKFDEIYLPKKLAFNLAKIRDEFSYIKGSINMSGVSDDLILKYFKIRTEKNKFSYYDLYYFRVLFLMRSMHKLLIEVNIYGYEAEIYWEEKDYNLVKKIIEDYEKLRKKLEWYRYSGNQVEKFRGLMERDKDFQQNFENEYKRYYQEMSNSIKFLSENNEDYKMFMEDIQNCIKMLKNKISENFLEMKFNHQITSSRSLK